MKGIFSVMLVIFFLPHLCSGQENDFTLKPNAAIFKKVSKLGWVQFQDSFVTDVKTIFQNNKNDFGLTQGYEMKLVRSRPDNYGYTHNKFEEQYNNVKIFGGEFLIHTRNGKVISGNGKIFVPKLVKSSKSISEQSALTAALKYVNAKSYYWQDAKIEARLKAKKKNPAATYFPKAGFTYLLSADSNALVLCYTFHIKTKEFGKSAICYIDASTGIQVKREPLDISCDPVTINTNWYGTQGISTNDVAVIGNSYNLEDDCQSSVYGVYDASDNNDIYNTGNNDWGSDEFRSAATSLWSIKESYIWYKNDFKRSGHDDNDGNLDIYQNYNFGGSNPGNNASYSYDQFGDDEIKVGTGSTNSVLDDYNALDILAHEFTHGVTQYEAQLVYQSEPGALNESFSDIMAEWIEHKKFGNNNWLLGWDRVVNGCRAPLRSLIDPGAGTVSMGVNCSVNFNQPNTYLGASWINTVGCTPVGPNLPNSNDFCGLHVNSGVQNQMFYLLSTGGSGWNNGQTCHAPAGSGFFWSVAGIGIDKAAQIAYKALIDYLSQLSTYPDARNAWVQAAENEFGTCSFEAIQAGKAWAAVGIGPPITQTIFLCNQTYGNQPYNLISGKAIATDPTCAVTILPTGNLVQFSGSRVTLSKGFSAKAGSKFRAGLSDCRYAEY